MYVQNGLVHCRIHYGFTMFLDKLHVFNVQNFLDTIIPRFQELYTKPSAVWIGRYIVNLDLQCILLLVMVTISWWNSKLNVKMLPCLYCLWSTYCELLCLTTSPVTTVCYRLWNATLLKHKASKRNLQVQLCNVIKKVKI